MISFPDSAAVALARARGEVSRSAMHHFFGWKRILFAEADTMNSRKKKVADPAKPRPQDLLRKMIASGKSVDSKAKNT